ncbi:MAG: hypothetical protein WD075_06285 [Rhodospirillales bacterium]
MIFKRNVLRTNRFPDQEQSLLYLQPDDTAETGAPERTKSLDQISTWLPTLRAYMIWSFGASIAWEITVLPLSPIWMTGIDNDITLAVIQEINADLFIALGALLATLFIFGNSMWPGRGYRHIAVLTIILNFCFSAMNYLVSADTTEVTLVSGAIEADTHMYAVVTHLKWIAIPAFALWQASRIARK